MQDGKQPVHVHVALLSKVFVAVGPSHCAHVGSKEAKAFKGTACTRE